MIVILVQVILILTTIGKIMYKVELSMAEIQLLLSALRYTTEHGYTFAHETNEEGGIEECNNMYAIYDKLNGIN